MHEINLDKINHTILLSAFDLKDHKQIHIAFQPKNHQWLLAEKKLNQAYAI